VARDHKDIKVRLGHRLKPRREPLCGEQGGRQILSGTLAVAGCDAPELFQFVEQSLGQIALVIEGWGDGSCDRAESGQDIHLASGDAIMTYQPRLLVAAPLFAALTVAPVAHCLGGHVYPSNGTCGPRTATGDDAA